MSLSFRKAVKRGYWWAYALGVAGLQAQTEAQNQTKAVQEALKDKEAEREAALQAHENKISFYNCFTHCLS